MGKKIGPKDGEEQSSIIYIGHSNSSREIQIDRLPTIYDILQLVLKHSFNRDTYSYKTMKLQPNNRVRFHYNNGIEKRSGKIINKGSVLHTVMDPPCKSYLSYCIERRGGKYSYLAYPPNDKIRLRQKDKSLLAVQEKNIDSK